jgi:signal peptidase I
MRYNCGWLRKDLMRVFLREILGLILLAVVIFLLLQVVFPRFQVVGSSMEPNLHDGQRLLINKAVYFSSSVSLLYPMTL